MSDRLHILENFLKQITGADDPSAHPVKRSTEFEDIQSVGWSEYTDPEIPEELYITFPNNVYSYDAVFHLPSRFLVEIEKEKYIFNKD